MRFKNFMRRLVGESSAEVLTFAPEHFQEAGVGFAPASGMPLLEAYQLVNKWNAGNQRFVYFLEA